MTATTPQGTVLDAILVDVRAELDKRRAQAPEARLRDRVIGTDGPQPAREVLPRRDRMHVIAEVKRRSPSEGALAPIADPASLAAQYEAAGASMVSVLTEKHHFGGDLADLWSVRDRVRLPVLRKDFIVDPYQVWETKAAGADVLLLIVAALSDDDLAELSQLAARVGLATLVEVHDEAEAARALAVGADLIGINARDLTTLQVDRATVARVRSALPAADEPGAPVVIAESGVRDLADVQDYAAAGADAVLVGQALVTAADPAATLAAFTGVPTNIPTAVPTGVDASSR